MIAVGAEAYVAQQAAIIEAYRKVAADRETPNHMAREAEARTKALAELRTLGMSQGDAIRALLPERRR